MRPSALEITAGDFAFAAGHRLNNPAARADQRGCSCRLRMRPAFPELNAFAARRRRAKFEPTPEREPMLKDAVAAAVLATTALPSTAAQIEVHGGTTITIDGKIEPDDFETFKVKAGPLGRAIIVCPRARHCLISRPLASQPQQLYSGSQIVPGERIGPVSLRGNIDEVKQLFGPGILAIEGGPPRPQPFSLQACNAIGLSVQFDSMTGNVVWISVETGRATAWSEYITHRPAEARAGEPTWRSPRHQVIGGRNSIWARRPERGMTQTRGMGILKNPSSLPRS